MRRFLIVAEENPANKSYVDNVISGYDEAIKSLSRQGAVKVGVNNIDDFNPGDRHIEYDCILYAGGLDGAVDILGKYRNRTMRSMMILSDSVLDGGLASLARLPVDHSYLPIYFISAIPAADYNARTNPFDRDALSIAAELISDLNTKSVGNGFKVFRWLHLGNGNDARSRLVDVIRTNVKSRTLYDGASNRKYIFQGNTRQNGTYHILQFRRKGFESQGEMVEVEERPAALKSQSNLK